MRNVWYAQAVMAVIFAACSSSGLAQTQDIPPAAPDCAAVSAVAVAGTDLDRTARALAGLPFDSGANSSASAAWNAHSQALSKPFDRLNSRQFKHIREWSKGTLEPLTGPVQALFYPFSGPDVLYATALFPDSRRMLFTGLELVGDVPQPELLKESDLVSSLSELRRSLSELLGKSFFVTARMQSQFVNNRFEGVTPILMLLLSRSGYSIDSVAAVTLGAQGSLCGRAFSDKAELAGVEIRYRGADDAEGESRSLVYLRVDLSNDGLKQTPQYAALVRNFKPDASYLKSASYLMYGGGFSLIRELLLETSPALLEDDSGIPYKFFPAGQWNSHLFGHYSKSASSFPGATQPALLKAFAAAPKQPLPFWIGYRHGPADSNLQLYLKAR
jgi:hypothetical protein